ncbi:MAG: mechanosensitive ion channel, partial [Deltaproteobacteria bacterium]|nr:mechanosensitive ion channel [Deltaproteobacteria bacterium]
ESITALLREWLPVLITLLVGIVAISAVYRILMKRQTPTSGSRISQQLLIAALGGVLLVMVILQLPIGEAERGQLLSLLGLLVTAAIALSSTTLIGNAMAGLMLRSIRNFRPGDFIVVDGHRGRVSELGLLRTEIQTERRNLTTPLSHHQPSHGGAPVGDVYLCNGVARLRRAARKDRAVPSRSRRERRTDRALRVRARVG